jgi:hypothetical protein
MQRHDFARFALGLSILLSVSLPASADSLRIDPPPGAEGFGGEVRGIADVNGDGAGDILAAAPL